jgi:hypothetical protein
MRLPGRFESSSTLLLEPLISHLVFANSLTCLVFISGEAANIFSEMSQNVSKEIEDEANSYFQRIYNHPPHPTLSIDEVLEMLKKFQDSPNKRERVRNTFIHKCVEFLQLNVIKSCMNSVL